jgi:hypothetical protein
MGHSSSHYRPSLLDGVFEVIADKIVQIIKAEYDRGDLSYIEAINELEKRLGYSTLEAESVVSEWQDENDGDEE